MTHAKEIRVAVLQQQISLFTDFFDSRVRILRAFCVAFSHQSHELFVVFHALVGQRLSQVKHFAVRDYFDFLRS